jgi:probable F420-dependent oxidoreductase
MRVGIKFPTRELGPDPGVIREWAAAAEEAGFDHIVVIDHVLGVDPVVRPDYAAAFPGGSSSQPFTTADEFHELFVLLGYLAAVTDLELATGILILPQRQTALVAKQAAEVDFLTGGRLRLAVGVGWNPVEFEALGEDFSTRGRKMEEQVGVLRALWTQETLDHTGEFDRIVGAGISPLPVQRPIPLWMGGFSDRVLDRIGRLADGWYGGIELQPSHAPSVEKIHAAAERAGRDPRAIGIEGAVHTRLGFDDVAERLAAWQVAGATHVTIDTMVSGRVGAGHVALLGELAQLVADVR